MTNKRLEAIIKPETVDDLELVEVLKEEFNISAAVLGNDFILPEGVDMPSDEEIAAAKVSLLNKYNQNQPLKERRAEYPKIGNQLDALYHDIINGNLTEETSSFVALIKEIKERYPKE
jgi:hypothetical protein